MNSHSGAIVRRSSLAVSSCLITGHRDNAALDLSFGYIPAGTYLINIHGFTAPIGTWESIGFPAEYSSSWGYYENGAEVTDYLPGTAMTIARDGDPHKVTPYVSPTIDPDAKETETPEEQTPAPTGPEKTRSRMTEMPEPVEENTGKAGLILGTAAGAVMIAGTAAAMLTVSRKDRKNPEQSAKN